MFLFFQRGLGVCDEELLWRNTLCLLESRRQVGSFTTVSVCLGAVYARLCVCASVSVWLLVCHFIPLSCHVYSN